MRKVLLTFSLLAFTAITFSQVEKNGAAKMFELEYENLQRNYSQSAFNNFKLDYDLYKINDKYHIGVLAYVDVDILDEEKLIDLEVLNDTQLENLYTFRVPLNNYASFLQVDGIEYIEIADPVSPFLENSTIDSRADSVQKGLGGLARAYVGKGVIVAVIDWGFDYTHPMFYDSTMTNLRLSRAWDQNKHVGTPPSGYNFGVEYSGTEDLLAAGSDTNYVFGYSSHGSHVAGIAGGAGAGTPHNGAAPESELIFISLRRDAPSLTDAFSYITNYAAAVNKPYVVNMSFGSHLGPHDGSSLKNLGIDILHGPGKIFVGSAGNNGETAPPFHLDRDFQVNDDTLKTVVNFGTGISDMFGQTLSMWGSENSDFSVSVDIADNSNNILYSTPYYSSIDEPTFIDTILLAGNDSLIVRMQSTKSFFLNGKPNIRLELKYTGSNKVILNAASDNSHLHIWNNVRMNNRYTNWGVALGANFPDAEAGNNDYGLGEPAGVGKNVITVASYKAEQEVAEDVFLYGQLSGFTSMGPTVDGRTKPDIASTGQDVMSSVNSFDITQGTALNIDFEGKEYGFARFSGTSMSGPQVAGIVALMLEANPSLSAVQAKEILKNTARLDDETGSIDPQIGDLQWGWGKANALAAVLSSEVYASVDEVTIEDEKFTMYPNPATEKLIISAEGENTTITEVEFIQIDGKTGKLFEVNENTSKIDLNLQELPKGSYIVKISTQNKVDFKKLIIQ